MISIDFDARRGVKTLSPLEIAEMPQIDQNALQAMIQGAVDRGTAVRVYDSAVGGLVIEWSNENRA